MQPTRTEPPIGARRNVNAYVCRAVRGGVLSGFGEACMSLTSIVRRAAQVNRIESGVPDFALRIAGFIPDRPSPAGRAQQGPDDPNQ